MRVRRDGNSLFFLRRRRILEPVMDRTWGMPYESRRITPICLCLGVGGGVWVYGGGGQSVSLDSREPAIPRARPPTHPYTSHWNPNPNPEPPDRPTHPDSPTTATINQLRTWEGVRPFLASLQTCSSTSLGVALAHEGGVRL